ncbi:MAG TPA: hypothetical protein VM840_09920, partial [Actinomycetota bacterium]|nr:hypothetical protein [Actinomycetota bacterium]
MNPRRWRIAALTLLTVTAGFGSYLAFTSGSGSTPAPAEAFEVSAQIGPGPRPGDLHALLAPT